MRPLLRLCLLGTFTVEGEPVGQVPVGKARRVLAVLAQRRGEFVTIEHLVDALWEDHPPDRADRNVAALISRLRRALGRELIEGSAAGYRIRADRVTVDLHEAADLVATAELELGQRRFALASTSGEQAAKLLDADIPMAGEHEDRWVRELRGARARPARTAPASPGAAAAVELGAYDTAVQVAGAVLHADPFDEEARAARSCSPHQRAGRPGSALLRLPVAAARALVRAARASIPPPPPRTCTSRCCARRARGRRSAPTATQSPRPGRCSSAATPSWTPARRCGRAPLRAPRRWRWSPARPASARARWSRRSPRSRVGPAPP